MGRSNGRDKTRKVPHGGVTDRMRSVLPRGDSREVPGEQRGIGLEFTASNNTRTIRPTAIQTLLHKSGLGYKLAWPPTHTLVKPDEAGGVLHARLMRTTYGVPERYSKQAIDEFYQEIADRLARQVSSRGIVPTTIGALLARRTVWLGKQRATMFGLAVDPHAVNPVEQATRQELGLQPKVRDLSEPEVVPFAVIPAEYNSTTKLYNDMTNHLGEIVLAPTRFVASA